MKVSSELWIGIDIGGTFTDLFVFDPAQGTAATRKVLTDHTDPTVAIERGLAEMIAAGDLVAERVERVVHGTTLVTNAVIMRRGAPTALLTTEGFRDSIESGTEFRSLRSRYRKAASPCPAQSPPPDRRTHSCGRIGRSPT